MPYTLPPITLTENVTSPVNIPGAMGSVTYLKMVNASPYLLQINNLLGGSDYMQPGEANVWPVPGLSTAVQVTPQQFALNPNVIPSSVLVVTWYLEGEQPNGHYPVNFNLLTFNGGNVGVASSIVNDTSPSGTQIIEARPAAAAGPYYLVTNDGNVTMRGTLTIGFKTGLVPPNVTIVDNGSDLTLAIGGLVGPGAVGGFGFSVISNGSAVTPFGIAQSPGVSPLSWIDGAGVLHATAPVTLAAGNQETGFAGFRAKVATVGDTVGVGVNFKTTMTNVPTSISTTIVSAVNVTSANILNVTNVGFSLEGPSNNTSGSWLYVKYTTVGNCVLALDMAARTFDHHCDTCRAEHRAISLDAILTTPGATPASSAASYICPDCGAVEHFTCGLTAADEQDATPQSSGEYATTRGAQATLIRQLMTALGMAVAA